MSLGRADFDYLQDLVRNQSAIVLDPEKKLLAERRLTELANQHGCATMHDFMGQLRGQPFCVIHRHLVDAMGNNDTWFFRDCHPFSALAEFVIPQLLETRTADRAISIWSAGCATGQEPFSIAMLLHERFSSPHRKFSILATDRCRRVLERARDAVYRQKEVNRGLPTRLLTRYFQQDGLHWRLDPQVRGMVDFRLMSLLDPWTDLPALDILFLRNVLTYFSPDLQTAILERAHAILRPGGFLFLGWAETMPGLQDRFERVQTGNSVCYKAKG